MQLNSTFPTVNAIETALIKILSDLAGEEITPAATLNSLKNTEIDSLGILQSICQIEEQLRISIPAFILDGEDISISQLSERMHNLVTSK